jgi:hypothetical protein
VSYQKLPLAAKETAARHAMREPSVRCPNCDAQVSPGQLMEHQAMRCDRRLPAPLVSTRWIGRVEALRYVPSRTLDAWAERGLVRAHAGRYVERDLAIATAWSRALGCL